MASKEMRVGDLVWAKMKGFPAWPGKIIQPKAEVRRPANKKNIHFVFFFGSENYAWIPYDSIWEFNAHKARFSLTNRIPRGFKEALEAVEDAYSQLPEKDQNVADLPSIDEELAQIFPNKTNTPHRDYSREPLSGKGKAKERSRRAASVDDNSSDSTANGLDAKKPREKRKKIEDIVSGLAKQAKTMRKERKSKDIREMKHVKVEKNGTAKRDGRRKRAASPTPTKTSKRSKMIVKFPPPASPNTKAAVASTSPPAAAPKPKPSAEPPAEPEPVITNTAINTPIVPYDTLPPPPLPIGSPEKAPPKNIIPTPLKIGFIGLGIMGQGMCMNLIKSGHEVTVWNRTAAKCREFVREGAIKGNSPAEVVGECDITFSCVSDPTAVKDLVFGNLGVLQGIGPGKAYVDLSTVDVETLQDVNESIIARGGRYLEAPVSGSRIPAEEGQLIILASGDRSLYDDCFSCFAAMGKKSFYLGEIGNGAKMKLVINGLMGTVISGLAESLALAEKAGLDQDEVLTVLEMSALASPIISSKARAMLSSNFEPHFPLQHQQKDLRLAISLGDQVDQPLHVLAAANELFKKAKAKGYGESDVSAVYRAADM